MKLTKIPKVLKLKQSDWMKIYINFNTKKRTKNTTKLEKDFFKLMINSVYGKTMENLRNRISVKIVNNEKHFLKHVSKPTFISRKIFDKNYVATHEIKPILTLNKPICVVFTVLEFSKWLMYDTHYNFIKKHFYGELLFTDTDSLTDEIKSEDVYEESFRHKHLFDLSNYPKHSKFLDPVNEKVIDKMKDVCQGKINDEFLGLKSKMFSIKNIDGKESNRGCSKIM